MKLRLRFGRRYLTFVPVCTYNYVHMETEYEKILENSESPFFTRGNLKVILGDNRRTVDYRIRALIKRGVLRSIKPGFFLNEFLYKNSSNPDEILCYVGSILVPQSYVSLQWALSKYGILAEGVYSLTFITIRKTRKFLSGGVSLTYRSIKPSLFFGFRSQTTGNFEYQIASPAKALFDYFYLSPSGSERQENRFNLDVLTQEDINEFRDFVNKSQSPKMRKILKYLYGQ